MAIDMNGIMALRRQAQSQQGTDQPPGSLQAAAGRALNVSSPGGTPLQHSGEPPLTPPVPGHPEAMQPTGTGMQMGLGGGAQSPDDVTPSHPDEATPENNQPDQGEFDLGQVGQLAANDQKQQAQAMSNISTPVANIMSKYGVMYSIFGLPGQPQG